MIRSIILFARLDVAINDLLKEDHRFSLNESSEVKGKINLLGQGFDFYSPVVYYSQVGKVAKVTILTPPWKVVIQYSFLISVAMFAFKESALDPIEIWVGLGIYFFFFLSHRNCVKLLEGIFCSRQSRDDEG